MAAPFPGDYARAQKAGVEAHALLVEPSGACGPELVQLLKDAAEFVDLWTSFGGISSSGGSFKAGACQDLS